MRWKSPRRWPSAWNETSSERPWIVSVICGGHAAKALARRRAEAIDAPPHEDRRHGDIEQEGQQHERGRPREPGERREDRGRDQHRDDRRRDGMREEGFDRLDVLGREADEIAGAPAQQISRCQRVELVEEVDAHLGQKAIGHVMRQPRLAPSEHARDRRDDQQHRERRPVIAAMLHRGDRER